MKYLRSRTVLQAQKLIGKNEKDGSFKTIIDSYNQIEPWPRNIKMSYDWEWCACTWSAIAKVLGYQKIMPIEISCGFLINEAKKMGIWKENDAYVPAPGDAILYDWQDNGNGDDTGWPDHVGIIETVNKKAGYFTVIEGNNGECVRRRIMSINGKYIRGFITPKYDDPEDETLKDAVDKSNNAILEENIKKEKKSIKEVAIDVISGIYGSGDARRKALTKAGYDPDEVQKKVNEILNTPNAKYVKTTCNATNKRDDLSGTYIATQDVYCRNDAGTNKKALIVIPKGTKVKNFGYFSKSNGTKWLLIQFELNKITYEGFTSIIYLKKV